VPKITAIVITLNEAVHIGACLESLAWADERLVVDSHSTDDTVAIARAAGARVEVRDWPGYGAQKNVATALASHDWIVSVDADERVSPELASEIRRTIDGGTTAAGYRMRRVSFHLGRWIRVTDWYPDWQARLYDRRRARWKETRVHESVVVDGDLGTLNAELQHLPFRDVADHVDTVNRYSSLAARELVERGVTSGPLRAFAHFVFAFFRNYILRRGFTAGGPGFVISIVNAYYVWLKFTKVWELQQAPVDTSRTGAAGTTSSVANEQSERSADRTTSSVASEPSERLGDRTKSSAASEPSERLADRTKSSVASEPSERLADRTKSSVASERSERLADRTKSSVASERSERLA